MGHPIGGYGVRLIRLCILDWTRDDLERSMTLHDESIPFSAKKSLNIVTQSPINQNRFCAVLLHYSARLNDFQCAFNRNKNKKASTLRKIFVKHFHSLFQDRFTIAASLHV